MDMRTSQAILFDWGDTVMRVFPDETGPMEGWRRVEAMLGIHEVLRSLRGSAQIVLATNAVDSSEDAIRRALARVDLDRHFDRVYCFQSVGHRKPSIEFFDTVLRDLGIDPARAWLVGDDFESDIAGANAAGMAAVWYAPDISACRMGERYRTIHAFSELPATLMDLGFDGIA